VYREKIVRPVELRVQVYGLLRKGIAGGRYSREKKLTEVAVAAEFGVSRTPAREALVMLAQEGILKQDGRGFRILDLSPHEMRDAFEVRKLIEPYAIAKIVAECGDDELTAACDAMETELTIYGTSDDYAEAFRRMRRHLFGLLKNAQLRKVIDAFDDQGYYVSTTTLRIPANRDLSVELNRPLIAALRRRDSDAASAQIRLALESALSAVLALEAHG
jgi:DNA-binding GntR family transcriptional regulator